MMRRLIDLRLRTCLQRAASRRRPLFRTARAVLHLNPAHFIGYFGDYELQKVLGEGGMGIVYKARQLSLNRPVALKMIQAARFASADEVRRFQNEAEAVARLDHPHIVPIFEVGQFEDQHYFSMKLIAGESLDKRLKDYVADPAARPGWWRSPPARSTTPTSAASSTAI